MNLGAILGFLTQKGIRISLTRVQSQGQIFWGSTLR